MKNYEIIKSGRGYIQSVLNEATADIEQDAADDRIVKRGIIVKGEALEEIFHEKNTQLRMIVKHFQFKNSNFFSSIR